MCQKVEKVETRIPSSGSSTLGFWGWRHGAGLDAGLDTGLSVSSVEGGRITAFLGFEAEATGDSCDQKDKVYFKKLNKKKQSTKFYKGTTGIKWTLGTLGVCDWTAKRFLGDPTALFFKVMTGGGVRSTDF